MCMFLQKKSLVPYSDVHDMVTDYGALFWGAYLYKKLWSGITKLGSQTRIISKQRAVGEF
jgi:hypothetical protein